MEIFLAIGFVLLAVVLLSVGVLLRKDGKFRSQHITQNKRMQERGIHCAVTQDREAKRSAANKIDVKSL